MELEPFDNFSRKFANLFYLRTNYQGVASPLTSLYRGADKSLARPGMKQARATEDFDFHIYHIYNHNWRNISIIYIYNKTNIKRNILNIKQNTSGSRLLRQIYW